MSTTAPIRPKLTRSGSISSRPAAPAAPAAAYSVSITATPAPIASPIGTPLRSVERIANSDSGPSWAATKNPRPKPTTRTLIGSPYRRRPGLRERRTTLAGPLRGARAGHAGEQEREPGPCGPGSERTRTRVVRRRGAARWRRGAWPRRGARQRRGARRRRGAWRRHGARQRRGGRQRCGPRRGRQRRWVGWYGCGPPGDRPWRDGERRRAAVAQQGRRVDVAEAVARRADAEVEALVLARAGHGAERRARRYPVARADGRVQRQVRDAEAPAAHRDRADPRAAREGHAPRARGAYRRARRGREIDSAVMAARERVALVRERPLDHPGHGRGEREGGEREREHGSPTVRPPRPVAGRRAWFVAKLVQGRNCAGEGGEFRRCVEELQIPCFTSTPAGTDRAGGIRCQIACSPGTRDGANPGGATGQLPPRAPLDRPAQPSTTMIRGAKVTLRPIEPRDREPLKAIRDEPEVIRFWGRQTEEWPGDDDSVEEWGIELGGELIGFVQFYEEPDDDYRHADVDILLATAHHGQGLGTDAMRAVMAFLVEQRGHHRITLTTWRHDELLMEYVVEPPPRREPPGGQRSATAR